MAVVFAQIVAVVKMNLLSLPSRLASSITTLFAVATVVTVLLAFMAMGEGFKKTMAGSGSEDVALMLRGGSQGEVSSFISGEVLNILSSAPGIAKAAAGEPIVSGELYVVVNGLKRATNREANLSLRGIGATGIALRSTMQLTAGRMFKMGTTEMIVGRRLVEQFAGFELNSTVRFGATEWTVVGIFDAGSSVFGSELLTDVRTLQSQFDRGDSYQSVRAKLDADNGLRRLTDFVNSDARLSLDVRTEKAYFSSQSDSVTSLITMGWGLAILMASGALAGALNTMYHSVASRSVEIATLRAIGFTTISAFIGTLSESLVVACLGGALGTLLAYLLFDGFSTSTMGGSFTQVAFDFVVTAKALKSGIILALVIGVVGGFFPARRAASLPVVMAFKHGV